MSNQSESAARARRGALPIATIASVLAAFAVAGCTVDDTQDAEDGIPFESILASASPSPPPKCEDYLAPGCGGPCPNPAQQQCTLIQQGNTSGCGCASYCTSQSAAPVGNACPAGFQLVTTSTVCSNGVVTQTKTCLKAVGSGCPTPGYTCKIVTSTTRQTIAGVTCTTTTGAPACAP